MAEIEEIGRKYLRLNGYFLTIWLGRCGCIVGKGAAFKPMAEPRYADIPAPLPPMRRRNQPRETFISLKYPRAFATRSFPYRLLFTTQPKPYEPLSYNSTSLLNSKKCTDLPH